MKIYQGAELSRDPLVDMEAATKRYVDNQITGSAVVGGLFFTNITPTSSGIVGSKAYVSGTVPTNTVITEGTADTDNVTVTLYAEGGSAFFSPTITITTVPAQGSGPIVATLTVPSPGDRVFTATAALTGITADTIVSAVSTTNATASATVRRAAAGPTITLLTIGSLPGSQTEVKSGDVVPVTGTVQNTATYFEIISSGASGSISVLSLGAANSGGAGFKTVSGTFVVSGLSGSQSVSGRAQNALGTFGSTLQSSNSITLNQTFPSIGARTITYPATQSGLKNTETATIASTVTNFDTIVYAGTGIIVSASTTYGATKTVTLNSTGYVFGTNNYTITATKASNGAVSTASSAITIATTAPTAAITYTPAGRMASSAAGVSHTVTITASQRLNVAPSMVASSGTWQGSWTQGANSSIWTRVLLIADSAPKGSQTFNTLSLTNLANVAGSTITSGSAYTVGGFVSRTITFPAFARFTAIGTNIVDITKVTASYTGGSVLSRQTSTVDVFQGFTIVDINGDYSATGAYLFISDSAFAGSNTSGTLQLDIAEAA